MNKRRIKVDKKDHFRAVLTDTAPSDVPIIFSNDGLYINHHKTKANKSNKFNIIASLYKNIISPIDNNATQDQNKQSYPLKYKIIKSEDSLRVLSLIHPRAQKNYCEFYSEYNSVITSICSQSPFSIRAPVKVCGSFYSSDLDPHNKYKEINIDTLEVELHRKHASSYFAYSGYNRNYKFYNSYRYLSLEQKYASMWTLDIANCFHSIYTHTISWAIKNKEFIKDNIDKKNQFCQKFDTLIQRSNNNETNGIPIGSEVSRVFAEIILQDIDMKIINLLNKYGLQHKIDYEIIRYVDDYSVFSHSNEKSEIIANAISDTLNDYNLNTNESKQRKYNRPFFTAKTKSIISVKSFLDELENTLIKKSTFNGRNHSLPKKIHNPDKFIHSFINKVKLIIFSDSKGYSEVSGYIISFLCRRSADIIISQGNNKNLDHADSLILRDTTLVILRIAFFFYSMNPTAPSSNTLAKTLVITDKFFFTNLPYHLEFYRTEIMANVKNLKFHRQKNETRNGFISLERLNILLATSEFGDNHLLQPIHFAYLEEENLDITYFDIVCLIYYFKTNEAYASARKKLLSIALNKFSEDFNLQQDSEQAHIFLDLTCCPYISIETRMELIKKYLNAYETNLQFSGDCIANLVTELETSFWFVKWKNLDLVKLLERKELKSAY